MRFTSATGQAKLTKIILNDISTDVRIEEFAQELDRRMVQKANGRRELYDALIYISAHRIDDSPLFYFFTFEEWMGAHLRRGDSEQSMQFHDLNFTELFAMNSARWLALFTQYYTWYGENSVRTLRGITVPQIKSRSTVRGEASAWSTSTDVCDLFSRFT